MHSDYGKLRTVYVNYPDLQKQILQIEGNGNLIISKEPIDETIVKIVYKILPPDFH